MSLTLLPHALAGFDADEKRPFEWALHPQFLSLYNQACTRLRQSKIAAQILDHLESQTNFDIVVLVSTTEGAEPNFYPAEEMARHQVGHLGDRSVVVWNPTLSLKVFDRKSSHESLVRIAPKRYNSNQQEWQSSAPKRTATGFNNTGQQGPAMGLIHELGHARQYCLKNQWFMSKFLSFRDQHQQSAKLDIENDNVLHVEIPVAQQLGEPTRWTYKDFG